MLHMFFYDHPQKFPLQQLNNVVAPIYNGISTISSNFVLSVKLYSPILVFYSLDWMHCS